MSTGAILLTDASPGAPRNAGTNGDLTTLLDWALPQAGWAIEYTSGNARVYRPPSGNRFRLHVNHDSGTSGDARLATVRGCEDASDAVTLIDPFPQVTQIGDTLSNWQISTAANTTTRAFKILVSPTFVIYLSNTGGTANVWEMGFFGDLWPQRAADTWATVCGVRNNVGAAVATVFMSQSVATLPTASSTIFLCRDITGTVKSSYGRIYVSGSGIGNVANMPAARAGYLNEIVRETLGITCLGSATTTPGTNALLRRAACPNLWAGMHSGRGSATDADTFTDTAYDAGSVFRCLGGSSTAFVILEESDTSTNPFT